MFLKSVEILMTNLYNPFHKRVKFSINLKHLRKCIVYIKYKENVKKFLKYSTILVQLPVFGAIICKDRSSSTNLFSSESHKKINRIVKAIQKVKYDKFFSDKKNDGIVAGY